MAAGRVSLRDIATQAGVHPSTVSLCLNDSPLVAERTRVRVRRIAEAMGYRAHPYVRELMRERRTKRGAVAEPGLAFVSLYPEREGWRERLPGLGKCIAAARERAVSRGFRFEELWIPAGRFSQEEVGEILAEKGISGVVLSPLAEVTEELDWPWERVAVVGIGPSLRLPGLNRVRSNHFKTMTTAIEECYRLGYRRFGFAIREEVNRRMDDRWLAAYIAQLRDLRIRDAPRPLLARDWNREEFLAWVRAERPDVVIVSNASRPMRWLEAGGFSVPEDVGVVSLSVPSLEARESGVYEHWDLQGERAVSILIHLLLDNELGLSDSPNVSLVDTVWHPGRTLEVKIKK